MQHDYPYPSHPEVVQGPVPARPVSASDLAPEVAPELGPEVVRPYSTLEPVAAQYSTLAYSSQAGGQHSTLEHIDGPRQHSTLEYLVEQPGQHSTVRQYSSQPTQRPIPDKTEKVAIDANANEIITPSQAGDRTTAAPLPWYRRRKALVLMAVGLVAVVAIAVGCGVGLTVGHKTGSASSGGSANTSRSACSNSICPQLLSAATFNNSLMIFAINSEKGLIYRKGDGLGSWDEAWADLFGTFSSRPAVGLMGPDHLYAFAVNDGGDKQVMQVRNYSNGVWSQSWAALGGAINGGSTLASAPVVCSPDSKTVSVWAVDGTGDYVIEQWRNTNLSDFWPGTQTWLIEPNYNSAAIVKTSAAPGVVCRSSHIYHDMVIYEKDNGTALVTHYNTTGPPPTTGDWEDWYDVGGSFTGHPVTVAVGSNRFDFFGIGTDKAMHHFSWTESGGYSSLENLGGSFQSVPSAFVTLGDQISIDVVAVGSNDNLMHRKMTGDAWVADWEDLGIFSNSAPLLTDVAGQPNTVALFFINRTGMSFASWKITSDSSWKSFVKPVDIGGSLSFATQL